MLFKRVQNFIFLNKLFERGEGILIGVSGGSDSVALVRILGDLRKKMDLKLSLLHINYGLRAEDSEKDEKFVREFAKKTNIELKVVRYKGKLEGNLEQNMRDFRYEEFEKQLRKEKFDWIAVGHTKDDQVETVLMNLVRGSGLKGLGGIAAKRGKVIRPLLDFEKEELVDYLKEKKQKFRVDQSNLDEKFLRNKIRHKLIPFLQEHFNPKIKSGLVNLSKQARSVNLFVEQIAQNTYNEIGKIEKSEVTFEIDDLISMDEFIRGFIFRYSLEHLKGNSKDISAAHLFEFEKMLLSRKSKKQNFQIGSIAIEKKGSSVIFQKK